MGVSYNDSIKDRFEPRWPPRSPHEALLSSPTGRHKIRQYHYRTSPSPSPLKKASSTPAFGRISRTLSEQSPVEDDDEDDEETLQLQLAALEAKLKLKKLQQKKDRPNAPSSGLEDTAREIAWSTGKENSQPLSQKYGILVRPALAKPKSSADVQIPLSPQRKRVAPEEARSPGRVLLGVDKGLKGKNISLRRPAGEIGKDEDPFRSNAPPSSISRKFGASRISSVTYMDQPIRPKSFSEKIAETRKQDKAERERVDKLRRQRSTGFGVKQQEIDTLSEAAGKRSKAIEDRSRANQAVNGEFSRDDVLKAANQINGGFIHRSSTSAGIRRSRTRGNLSTDIWVNPNAPPEPPKPPRTNSNDSKKRTRSLSPPPKAAEAPSRLSSPEASSLFEPFSSLHLSKRLLPHDFLTRSFSEKHVFRLPDLLQTVKSPDYCLPDISESDHIVLAIVASKSSPLTHKGAHRITEAEKTLAEEAVESEQNANGKYMVLTLTDLKWTVDLFLFTTAYTRFRKLTPGTLVALLNPDIMPPPPGKADTGRFSLKLASSDDTVLEIGTSRDLGWCKSVRKDGKQCSSWINKRHTEFCEFHIDVVVERTRRGRMEVQGMSAPFAPGGRKGGRTGHFGEKRRGQKPTKEDGFIREGPQYDRSSGSRYFLGAPVPGGRSAAQLLDAEGTFERGGSKEERMRKRLAEREKEDEIARKLGEGGNGAGSEYLRIKRGGEAVARGYADPQAPDPVDATSLGLLGNRATNVHLSPMKKRKASGLGAEGSRKKTRFVTDRGIKEAGRESFGGELVGQGDEQDDDDGLEVV